MNGTPFDTRSSEWIGDMAAWMQQNCETNEDQHARLRRRLREARLEELTPRQQEFLTLYYDQGCNIPQIAEMYGINRSSVSRTLRRARARLLRALRYAL